MEEQFERDVLNSCSAEEIVALLWLRQWYQTGAVIAFSSCAIWSTSRSSSAEASWHCKLSCEGLWPRQIIKEKSMLYNIALFTHIVGVLGIFTSIALELASLFGLRRASSMVEVRAWTGIHKAIAWGFPLAAPSSQTCSDRS